MEDTTTVNVCEETGALALPRPLSKRDLVTRLSAGFLAGAIPATGFAVWALVWATQSPYRAAVGQLAVGVSLMLVVFLWLALSESLRSATPQQLERLERLAQEDAEVRRFLRSICDTGRPILTADVTQVLRRDAKLKAKAEAKACAARTEALQARIRALVGAHSATEERPSQRVC